MKDKILEQDIRHFAERLTIADHFRGAVVAVTGATGLLGSCMVRCLLALNAQWQLGVRVVAVVRSAEKFGQVFGQESAELLCHLHDFSSGKPLHLPFEATHIIHFASPTASRYFVDFPVETADTILVGTRTVLEYARAHRLQSLIFVSSLEVYGVVTDDSLPLTEDRQGWIDPMSVRSGYPMAKRMAECLCHAYAKEYGVPVRVARLAQTFGAGVAADDNRVFAQFARNIIQGENIVLHTTGELSRCYCYTTDALSALMYLMAFGQDGEAYNVANESTYISVIDMARFLCAHFNTAVKPVIQLQEGLGYSPVTRLRLDCQKLRALGWEPHYNLEEMFDHLIKSMQ